MKNNKLFLMLAAAALLTTACSQHDEPQQQTDTPQKAQKNIFFSPMEFGMLTRATATTTADITTFGVSCAVYPAASTYATAGSGSYFYNEPVDAAIGTCKYFWPGSSYRVAFYAYVPYGNASLSLTSPATQQGFPTYTYTVPQNVTSQRDVMTASVIDNPGTPTDTPVTLTFYHRLTDIRFSVTNQHPENALTVKSIKLCGVKNSGTYTTGSSWVLTGDRNTEDSYPLTYSPNTVVAPEETADITATSCHFMVLPQTVTAGTTFLVVTTEEYGAERTYRYVPEANISLEMGKSYRYTLILGDGRLIVDPDTDINDWTVEVRYLTGNVNVNTPDGESQSLNEAATNTNDPDPTGQNVGSGSVETNDSDPAAQGVTGGGVTTNEPSPGTQTASSGSVIINDWQQ